MKPKVISNFKVFPINLGCKVNLYEINDVISQFLAMGCSLASSFEEASLYIINSCTVTNKADQKTRLMINKCIKNNPSCLIILMGCYSQVNPEGWEEFPNLAVVIGNKKKNQVVKLFTKYLESNQTILDIEKMTATDDFENVKVEKYHDHTRAFLKIQDGCNYACSYCIIPRARGVARSKPTKDIINEIKSLINLGYKEMVLTGINIASYHDNGVDFSNLLQQISDLEGDFRIRISSVEPFQIDDSLINTIVNNPKFCQHLHLCIQSGCDRILDLMRRKYHVSDFKTIMDKIRNKNPLFCFTTDIIVGFPSESAQDFINGFENLKQLDFASAHIFTYSKRKNTPAALMKQQIIGTEKKRRFHILQDFYSKAWNLYNQKFLNKIVEVIFEAEPKDGYQSGHSSEFLNVSVKTNVNLAGKKLKVKIEQIINGHAFGSLV